MEAEADQRAQRCVAFLLRCGGLKREKRTGWLRHLQAAQVESVADHSHRVALASLLLCTGDGAARGGGADVGARAALIGLVHDLAEAVTGDTVSLGQTAAEKAAKHQEEARVMAAFTRGLAPHPSAGVFEELWGEYEGAASPAARAVKDADKLEMMLQALEYETAHPPLRLDSFYAAAQGVKGLEARAWAREILRLRAELLEQRSASAGAAQGRLWWLGALGAAAGVGLGAALWLWRARRQ